MKKRELLSLPTPVWIFSPEVMARAIRGARSAMRASFGDKWRLSYSVKTNSEAAVLRVAKACGCMAETVSEKEWKLARESGFEPDEIVYNGPLKTKETFIEAVLGGATVNIETWQETEWLEEVAHAERDRQLKVGVRLSVPGKLEETAIGGTDGYSRFGFSDESGELGEVIGHLRTMPNVTIAGVHVHRTSTRPRRAVYYEKVTDWAIEVARKHGLTEELEYVDTGGGYSPTLPGTAPFEAYTKAIAKALKKNGVDVTAIMEPGRALVGPAFTFLTKVIDSRLVTAEVCMVTTDGSRMDIDPFYRVSQPEHEIIEAAEDVGEQGRSEVACHIVGGCTCIDLDRMLTLNSPRWRIMAGDRILYRHAGAYTMALTPEFIRPRPKVHVAGTMADTRETD